MLKNNEQKKLFAIRMLAFLLAVAMFLPLPLIGGMTAAYCSEAEGAEAIGDLVETVAEKIYTLFRQIVTPIVICMFAYAGFQFLLGGNRGTEKARSILFGACIGLILVAFAPIIGKEFAKWFVNYGGGSFSGYNPLG